MVGQSVAAVVVLVALALVPAASALDYDDARTLAGEPRDGWYDTDPPRIQAAITEVGYGYQFASATCFLRSDHTVACLRDADSFDDDFDVERIPDDSRGVVAEVSAYDSSVCYLEMAGNVSCYNAKISKPTAQNYTGGDAVQATGNRCILKANGTVQCLGLEAAGYLHFGAGLTQIDARASQWVCGVTATGDADCWFFGIGCNPQGCVSRNQTRHFGFGDAVQVQFARGHVCILRSSGNVECFNVEGWFDPPPAPYTGGDAVSIHGWNEGLCITKTTGTMTCEGTRGPDPGCVDYCEDRRLPDDPRGGGAVAVEMSYADSCWTYADGTITCESDEQPLVNLPDDLGHGLDDVEGPVTAWTSGEPWTPAQAGRPRL